MEHTATIGFGHGIQYRKRLSKDLGWRYPRTLYKNPINWKEYFTPYLQGHNDPENNGQMNRILFGIRISDPSVFDTAMVLYNRMVWLNRHLLSDTPERITPHGSIEEQDERIGLAPLIYMLFEGDPVCRNFIDKEAGVWVDYPVTLIHDEYDEDRLTLVANGYAYFEEEFSYNLVHRYEHLIGRRNEWGALTIPLILDFRPVYDYKYDENGQLEELD